MAHPQLPQLMTELGIQGAFGLKAYMNAETSEESINEAYILAKRLYEPESASRLVDTITKAFADREIPLNLRAEHVTRWFPAMAGEHIKQQNSIVRMIDSLCGDREVVGCIVHEDVTPDARAIVMYCNAHGIPTLHVPHANCFYIGEEWDIHTESISSHIAASGQYMKEFYVKWGYNEANITITGMPQLDSVYADHQPSRKEARQVLGIDADEKRMLLVYATSWGQLTSERGGFEDEYEQSLQEVLETVKELDTVLCVKMHPGEAQGQEQTYLNALKESGIEGFVTRGYNEYILRAADVLVSHGPSNICVIAASIGLPCAYCPTEDFEFPFPSPVLSRGNLTHAVRVAMKLDKEKTWGVFAKKMNDAHGEGNAVERITELCQSLFHG